MRSVWCDCKKDDTLFCSRKDGIPKTHQKRQIPYEKEVLKNSDRKRTKMEVSSIGNSPEETGRLDFIRKSV